MEAVYSYAVALAVGMVFGCLFALVELGGRALMNFGRVKQGTCSFCQTAAAELERLAAALEGHNFESVSATHVTRAAVADELRRIVAAIRAV